MSSTRSLPSPLMVAPAMVLPTVSVVISTGSGTGGGHDLGGLQVLSLGEGPLVVGDRAFGALDGGGGALVALGALTDATDERLARAFAPGAVRGCVEVLLEVVGGARLVRCGRSR